MINWYPGHMARAKEKLKERAKVVDVVIELLDARIPSSSCNPELNSLIGDKKKITALNKMDLANKEITDTWIKRLSEDRPTVAINSLNGQQINLMIRKAKNLISDKLERLKQQGIQKKTIRLMIIGIPNVGKSQLINQLCERGSVRTGNQPGVTRGQQWIKVRDDLELLDTPGILWPKIDDEEISFKLAATGAVTEDAYDPEVVGYKLLKLLKDLVPDTLQDRFNLARVSSDTLELMEDIGCKRGCIMSGGKIDRERTGNVILNEFQSGKLGRISLETP